MKRRIHTIGLGVLGIVPALAIEPPPDNAPPPPSVESRAEAFGGAFQAPAASSPAFLGLISAEVPAMLATHLGLQAGQGVIVSALVPDGPAQQAGLVQHDVILRLAGHSIGSPAALSERLASYQPGDSVEIDLIHGGKELRKSVTLGARPADQRIADASGARSADPFGHLDHFSPSQLDRIRGIIERNLQDTRKMEMGGIHSHFDQAIREMQERMAEMEDGNFDALPPNGKIQFQSDATFRLSDDQGSIEIKSRDRDKEVTVRDADNRVLWSGPWNNDQDESAAPEDIRARIEKLNIDENFQGNGLRLRFGPGFNR